MTDEIIHYCHSCGKIATIFDIDPYTEEFASEEEKEKLELEWFCDECFENSIWDI